MENEPKTPETPQASPTPSDSEDNAPKFSQKDLDKAVEARLAREKAKYNDLKTQAQEYSSLKSKVGEYEAKLAKFSEIEETLNLAYNDMLESIPEDKRSLIPDSLSTKEKISYIKTNKNHLIGVNTNPKPIVPEVPKQPQNSPNNFGGYSSAAEWSIKDPIGYRKASKQF